MRRNNIYLFFVVVVVFVVVKFFSSWGDNDSDLTVNLLKLQKQRNELWRLANKLAREKSSLECEKVEWAGERNGRAKVAGHGGWCKDVGRSNSTAHVTDYNLAEFLADFFQGKTVGSFGDGPGLYKQALDKTGLLKFYAAFDGAPFVETTSDGNVRHLDLTVPAYGLPIFDWVMSLEVAEHIPREYEDVFVDNLARHAKEGIILSWAKLGQGGLAHVNNRAPDFVVNKMAAAGFEIDVELSRRMKEVSSLPWLKNNVNVYRRKKGSEAELIMA